jgi:hypothetical protein
MQVVRTIVLFCFPAADLFSSVARGKARDQTEYTENDKVHRNYRSPEIGQRMGQVFVDPFRSCFRKDDIHALDDTDYGPMLL